MIPFRLSRFSSNIIGIKKTYISQKDKTHSVIHVKEKLKQTACEVCRNEINEIFINSIMSKFTDGIIYKNNADEILAFALWTKTFSKGDILTMILHLICTVNNTKKLGNHMMNDVINECKRQKIKQIILTPSNKDLIYFYERFNAKRINPDNNSDLKMKIIVKPINLYIKTRGRTQKRKNNTRKNNNNNFKFNNNLEEKKYSL